MKNIYNNRFNLKKLNNGIFNNCFALNNLHKNSGYSQNASPTIIRKKYYEH